MKNHRGVAYVDEGIDFILSLEAKPMLELSFMPSLLAKNTLVKMGDKLLQQGEGYLVSQRGKELQIFLYNYSHYDLLYHYRHVANISRTDRNQVFVCQQSRAFYIRLQNLPEGMYRVSRYGITRSGGSSYDAWVRMGAPSPVDQEERELLLRLACRPLT